LESASTGRTVVDRDGDHAALGELRFEQARDIAPLGRREHVTGDCTSEIASRATPRRSQRRLCDARDREVKWHERDDEERAECEQELEPQTESQRSRDRGYGM